MTTYQEIKDTTVENLLEITKYDLPKPPSLELIMELALRTLTSGCHTLGIELHAEYGGINQPRVPQELTKQLQGCLVKEPMLVNDGGIPCLVASIGINPPKGFLEQPNAYDKIHEYTVKVGQIIPKDSDIRLLTLVDARGLDGIISE